MTNNLEDDRRALVAGIDNQESQDNTQSPQDAIQDVYVLIVREQAEEQTQIVDNIPTQPAPVTRQQDSFLSAYAFVCCSLLLIASTLAFQVYCVLNPLLATVTLIPRSQQVTISGTMQLGRVLPPLTISQSQTTRATGTGHQIAKAATGYLTFYNGQFQSVTIAAGTILTGASGVQIITDQDAVIPPANPPVFGQVSVPAHALHAGSSGNIPADDINQACCAASVLVKNTTVFSGGQDERTYTIVTHKDIHSLSTVLKTTLAQSITGALQGQLKPEEQLQLLPCSPTVTSDHQPGEETATVTVTVSQTCSAVAYNRQELMTKAAALLATQATQTIGTGYSLFGIAHVTVKQANVSNTPHPLVFLSFQAGGTWVYGLSYFAQQQIKRLLAGKSIDEAKAILQQLQGIQQSGIQLTGLTDRIPKNCNLIHLVILYEPA